LAPCLTAIDRFENASSIAVEDAIFPWSFTRFPKCSVNNGRIVRIDLHIARADVLIAVQHLFECFAAIDRSINTAFFVRPVRMTGYGNKDPVRIFWIDRQLRDLLPVKQSEMRPRFSSVSRFINAITD
jgi:hypothetical protein